MKLSEARSLARRTANEANKTTFVYLDTLHTEIKDYDVAFSIPSFRAQEGDPFEPIRIARVEPQLQLVGSLGGATNTLRASAEAA